MTPHEKCYRLGQERSISKPIDGWTPPDTAELIQINKLLNQIGNRIHSLRVAVLLNAEQENGRIRRIMARRKSTIEKAYKKGLYAGRKRRRHL